MIFGDRRCVANPRGSSLIASGNETPSRIDDDISDDRRISKRWVRFVYDRSGAFERDIQYVNVDLFCVEQTVVLPEILYSKLHDLPCVALRLSAQAQPKQ
jgi:hypothetical protein